MDHRYIITALLIITVGGYVLFTQPTAQGDDLDDVRAAAEEQGPDVHILNNQRFTIESATTSYTDANPNNRISVTNTLMLDTQTGKTWVLNGNPKSGYKWGELNKVQSDDDGR